VRIPKCWHILDIVKAAIAHQPKWSASQTLPEMALQSPKIKKKKKKKKKKKERF
jgi:hypothetical protein